MPSPLAEAEAISLDVGPRDKAGAASLRVAGAVVLGASLVAGALWRFWVCRHDDGVFWPDEIYQSLEPAHRAAFGYGLVAWEFMKGARNWALAGCVAALMKGSVAFGLAYLPVVRGFFCAVGIFTVWTVQRLARALGASALPAATGAAMFALMNLAIFFAPRGMSETASAPLLVLGLALAVPKGMPRWQLTAGLALLCAAVFVRMQSGFYCLGLLAILAGQRRRADLLHALAVFAVGAAVFGLVDRLTWGGWFHSALEYLRFNLIEGKSGNFGRNPVPFYIRVLWLTLGPLLLALAATNVLAAKRAWHVLAMPALFLVIHSLIVHKELRFLFPALAILCGTGAVGLQVLLERTRPALWATAHAAVLAAAVASAFSTPSLTFGRFGLYERPPGVRRVLDDGGPENRLLLAARERPDLCGLLITSRQLGWTGGYSYLHRPVPLYGSDQAEQAEGAVNYVIGAPGSRAGDVVAEDSGLALIRLSNQGCRPDPRFDWHLN